MNFLLIRSNRDDTADLNVRSRTLSGSRFVHKKFSPVNGDRLIRVGLFQGDLGNEHLPRNAPEGRLIDVMELNGIVFEKLTRTGR